VSITTEPAPDGSPRILHHGEPGEVLGGGKAQVGTWLSLR